MPSRDSQLNKIICDMFGYGLNVKLRISDIDLDLSELRDFIDEREKISYEKGKKEKIKK